MITLVCTDGTLFTDTDDLMGMMYAERASRLAARVGSYFIRADGSMVSMAFFRHCVDMAVNR